MNAQRAEFLRQEVEQLARAVVDRDERITLMSQDLGRAASAVRCPPPVPHSARL
jgi:hypothetical protein